MNFLTEQIKPYYEDIKKVIAYSQEIENPKIDKLLDTWSSSKSMLSNNFLHRQLSYTYPEKISFELSEDAKDNAIDNFIQSLEGQGHKEICNFLYRVSVNEFFNNTLEKDYIINEKDNKKIPKGSKIIKSFKYFIEEPQYLHDIQDWASRIIQENKVEGYLTFSIHPLDFLSSSENIYNWRSCHSLDGEYRAGNLSYICDYSTMIVYLSEQEKNKLPNFPKDVPWNSKKWRVLLHFDKWGEVCFAGRQYPFESKGALEKVREIFIKNLIPNDDIKIWSDWCTDYVTSVYANHKFIEIGDIEKVCVINNGLYKLKDIIKSGKNSQNYNDLLDSTVYTEPFFMYKKYLIPNYEIKIQVGAAAPCIYCEKNEIDVADSMLCKDCYREHQADFIYCDFCNRKIYEDEETTHIIDEQIICEQCYNEKTYICPECSERHLINNYYTIPNSTTQVCYNCICKYLTEEES